MVQWLRFKAFNAGGMGLIPVQGTKIPRATWRGQTTVATTKLFKKKFKRRRVCKDRTWGGRVQWSHWWCGPPWLSSPHGFHRHSLLNRHILSLFSEVIFISWLSPPYLNWKPNWNYVLLWDKNFIWHDLFKSRTTIYVWMALFSGEGNGTPLQCSCLENPMDGGAW